jgi:multidrug efflux pump
MRRSLGTAVFSGMLGVTLFGIFLTPVFFSVILGLSETRLFAADATRWIGSAVAGGLVGLGIGFLLAQLNLVGLSEALRVAGPAGVLIALAALGIHRRIRPRSTAPGRVPHSRPNAVVPSGDPQP